MEGTSHLQLARASSHKSTANSILSSTLEASKLSKLKLDPTITFEEEGLVEFCSLIATTADPEVKTALIDNVYSKLMTKETISQGLYSQLFTFFSAMDVKTLDSAPQGQVLLIQGLLDSKQAPGLDGGKPKKITNATKSGQKVNLYAFSLAEARPRDLEESIHSDLNVGAARELEGSVTLGTERPASQAGVYHKILGYSFGQEAMPFMEALLTLSKSDLQLTINDRKLKPIITTLYRKTAEELSTLLEKKAENPLQRLRIAFLLMDHPQFDSFFSDSHHGIPGSIEFSANTVCSTLPLSDEAIHCFKADKDHSTSYKKLWGEASLFVHHVFPKDISATTERESLTRKDAISARILLSLHLANSYANICSNLSFDDDESLDIALTLMSGIDNFITISENDLIGFFGKAQHDFINTEFHKAEESLKKLSLCPLELPLQAIVSCGNRLIEHRRVVFAKERGAKALSPSQLRTLFQTLRQLKHSAQNLVGILAAVTDLESQSLVKRKSAFAHLGLAHLLEGRDASNPPSFLDMEKDLQTLLIPHLNAIAMAPEAKFPEVSEIRNAAHDKIRSSSNYMNEIIEIYSHQRLLKNEPRVRAFLEDVKSTVLDLPSETPFETASKILSEQLATVSFRLNFRDPNTKKLLDLISTSHHEFARTEFKRLQSISINPEYHDFSQFNRPTMTVDGKWWPKDFQETDPGTKKDSLKSSPVSNACSCNATMALIHMMSPGRSQDGPFPFDAILDEAQALYYSILEPFELEYTSGVNLTFDALKPAVFDKKHLVAVSSGVDLMGTRDIVVTLTNGQEQKSYTDLLTQLKGRIPVGKSAIGGLIQNGASIYAVHVEKVGGKEIYTIVDSHGLGGSVPTGQNFSQKAFKISFESVKDAALFLKLHKPYNGKSLVNNTCVVLPVIGPEVDPITIEGDLLATAATKHAGLAEVRRKNEKTDIPLLKRLTPFKQTHVKEGKVTKGGSSSGGAASGAKKSASKPLEKPKTSLDSLTDIRGMVTTGFLKEPGEIKAVIKRIREIAEKENAITVPLQALEIALCRNNAKIKRAKVKNPEVIGAIFSVNPLIAAAFKTATTKEHKLLLVQQSWTEYQTNALDRAIAVLYSLK